jgi:hypothetical protein
VNSVKGIVKGSPRSKGVVSSVEVDSEVFLEVGVTRVNWATILTVAVRTETLSLLGASLLKVRVARVSWATMLAHTGTITTDHSGLGG